jgi:ribosomal protein L18
MGMNPMAYRSGDDGMDERQKDEMKRARAERDQLKKDRDAQRLKVRKDQIALIAQTAQSEKP